MPACIAAVDNSQAPVAAAAAVRFGRLLLQCFAVVTVTVAVAGAAGQIYPPLERPVNLGPRRPDALTESD
jgi:hypothetical protein